LDQHRRGLGAVDQRGQERHGQEDAKDTQQQLRERPRLAAAGSVAGRRAGHGWLTARSWVSTAAKAISHQPTCW
jgi:hypothetical protein